MAQSNSGGRPLHGNRHAKRELIRGRGHGFRGWIGHPRGSLQSRRCVDPVLEALDNAKDQAEGHRHGYAPDLHANGQGNISKGL